MSYRGRDYKAFKSVIVSPCEDVVLRFAFGKCSGRRRWTSSHWISRVSSWGWLNHSNTSSMHASAHCQFWGVSTHGCLLGAIQLQQMKLKGFVVVHLHGTNIQWYLSNTDTLGIK